MRHKQGHIIRLYLVGIAFVLITLVLWGRLVQVQVLWRAHYADIANNQWRVTKKVAPIRGGIFDRHGRPLALSIRSCSVSIRPKHIEDPSEVASVLSKRLSLDRRVIRKALRADKPFVWVKRRCSLSESDRGVLNSLAGVDVHLEADRVYPYAEVASKIVGFVGYDNKGMAGIEAAFDNELKGKPGWQIVQRDGTYRSKGYHTYAEKKPRHGKHVVLTIDVQLQEIAEEELERAVHEYGAKGGALIVMACDTGEILALAESPWADSRGPESRIDSLWTLRSISMVYEPGSTFKLITAAALLETNSVRETDVFNAEDGRADLGVAVISDSHPHEELTFREGFVFSSNIVMAKASQRLDPREFYKFIRLFGFGSKTGIRLLGESAGHIAPTEEWSDRSQVTMAFGQEIAATPLQMVNAFAAVANGGALMVPSIVRSVYDEATGDMRTFKPVKVRNVVSGGTSRKLRDMCRSVVEEGTGTAAAVPFIKVSGKTGTAEKASPKGGYLPNKFVASFIGFAPYDDPRITCLVMLDEPGYYYRFGGVSAAPVFARISNAIANSTGILDGMLADGVVEDPPTAGGPFRAPNFLRLDRETALERGRHLDLNILCRGTGSIVVAQHPDPGVAMGRDEVVRLTLGGSDMGTKPTGTPDLRGLPLRLARRRAIEAGLRCDIRGTGSVVAQTPAPGQIARDGVVKIECRAQSVGKIKG